MKAQKAKDKKTFKGLFERGVFRREGDTHNGSFEENNKGVNNEKGSEGDNMFFAEILVDKYLKEGNVQDTQVLQEQIKSARNAVNLSSKRNTKLDKKTNQQQKSNS